MILTFLNVFDFLSNFPSQDPCPRLLIENEGLEFKVKTKTVQKNKKVNEKNFMDYPLVDGLYRLELERSLKMVTSTHGYR